MDIYFSSKPTSSLQTNHILTTVSNLYRLKILADDSKAWAEVGDFTPRLWGLTNRSTCIYYMQVNTPGCVRITGDRIRWAPTQDGSQKNPQLDIDLTQTLPSADCYFTLVIEHCDPSQGVAVIESTSREQYEDGVYTSDTSNVKIIDANSYQGTELMWRHPDGQENLIISEDSSSFYPNLSEIEIADAISVGFKYMTRNMTKAERMQMRKHYDSYRISLDKASMNQIVKRTNTAISMVSSQIADSIDRNLDPAQDEAEF